MLSEDACLAKSEYDMRKVRHIKDQFSKGNKYRKLEQGKIEKMQYVKMKHYGNL